MPQTGPIDFHSTDTIYELDFWRDDEKLIRCVKALIDAQKAACLETLPLHRRYRPEPKAAFQVSPEALEARLASGEQIDAAATHGGISMEGPMVRRGLARLREKVDRMIAARIQALFQNGSELAVWPSGNFWYPPDGFMGWHTHLNLPGWRLYINYSEEGSHSFFRYRDPETGEVVTAWDKGWNFRLFRVSQEKPIWHALYSGTNRFSLSYLIRTQDVIKPVEEEQIVPQTEPAWGIA